jgi:hypothetical protein
MEEPVILYCELCNPDQLHQKDRRKSAEQTPNSNVIPFPKDRRSATNFDRRAVLDRRVGADHKARIVPVKRSKGRRPFDGHSWFVGTVETAVKEQWDFQNDGQNTGKKMVCPRCQCKIV